MSGAKFCVHRDNTWVVFALGVAASFIANVIYDWYTKQQQTSGGGA